MSEHWQSRPEGGGRFALWLIRSLALHGGRTLAQWLICPVSLYFFLRRGPERRASRQFLQRAFGRPVGHWQVLRHFYSYAITTVDRIFLLARGEASIDVEVQGLDALEAALAPGRGLLLLGSHQGSFEALRAIAARQPQVPLRVVLDKGKTPAMTELLEALAPEIGANVIDASQDGLSITLAMAETCQRGGMVAMLADRGRAHETLRRVDFMGSPAPFPVGPWLLAHTLKVPVVLCFGLYLGGRRYRLIFEPMAEQVEIPRHARGPALDALIGRYARRLEHYVEVAPYNWFNFYDFWQDPAAMAVPVDDAVGERVNAAR